MKRIVSFSGGKDSTALYLWALERTGGDFIPVFADTGHEHPLTLDFVRDLPRKTGGPDIRTVKADFADAIARRRMFIARDHRIGRRDGRQYDLERLIGPPACSSLYGLCE